MTKRTSLPIGLVTLLSVAILFSGLQAQDPTDKYVAAFDKLGLDDGIVSHAQSKLAFAIQLARADKPELADAMQQDVADAARKNEAAELYPILFLHALDRGQIEKAEGYLAKCEKQSDRLTKKLVIGAFRSGDKSAVESDKVKFDDFYHCLELADAMIEAGDIKAAHELASNLQFHERDGNDPKDGQGIILEKIAQHYQAKGDLENARKYIDESVKVAGKQYYTGYCLQVTHRAIHGKLTKDMQKFAKTAEYYRGNQGKELLGNYAQELYENGYYDEAKQIFKKFNDDTEADYSTIHMARHQAQQGEFDLAKASISTIKVPEYRFRANVFYALELLKAGRENDAVELVDSLENIYAESKTKPPMLDNGLAYLLGRLNDEARIQEFLGRKEDELRKSRSIIRMMQGLTKASFY